MAQARMPSRLRSIALAAAIVVGAASALVQIAVATFVGRGDVDEYVARYATDTERALRAAIDPRFQTKAEEIGRVASRLVIIEAIKGGALYDDTGHLLETFGEAPETSFAAIEHTGRSTFRPSDASRLEFYFPPDATGTPIHIVARVDSGQMQALEGRSASRNMMIALSSALMISAITAVGAWIGVGVPVRQIIRALEKTTANPAAADIGPSLSGGPTEIGTLAMAVDRFRGTIADVWRGKVAVADAVLDRSPFAVIQMAVDGSATFANPAAVRLFDRDFMRTAEASPLVVRDVLTGGRSVLMDYLHLHQDDCRLIEIAGPVGSCYAVVGSLVIGEGTRTPTTVAMFADVTPTQRARNLAEQRLRDELLDAAQARRRTFELRQMLESCLTLMAGPDKGVDAHLDVVPFAQEWLESAEEAGLVSAFSFADSEGPTVAGPADDLRVVMRLGLLVAATRGSSVPVKIIVDARGINFETAGMTIRAEPDTESRALAAPPTADWRVAFAALRSAIRKVNGQLSDFTVEPDAVTVRFILRGAAERMSAVKTR